LSLAKQIFEYIVLTDSHRM